MEYPDQAGMPYRYSAKGVRILPAPNSITLTPVQLDDDSLLECQREAIVILEKLEHTPVIALGTNFGFVEPEPEAELLRYFELADGVELSVAGAMLLSTDITRRISYQDRTFNLKLGNSDGRVEADFNFHRQTRNSRHGAEQLADSILQDRDVAIEFLLNVYNLNVTPEVGAL